MTFYKNEYALPILSVLYVGHVCQMKEGDKNDKTKTIKEEGFHPL